MKTKLTERIAYWEALTAGVVADYQRLSRACDAARVAGCMEINGPLHEAIWLSFESMLTRIDFEGWLSWFIQDNDCGASGLWARLPGKKARIAIITPRQLARLIAAEEAAGSTP